MAHALRHAPHLYELELDEAGWTDTDALLTGLRRHRHAWRDLEVSDLERIVANSSKNRYELSDDRSRVRARCGHSTEGKLRRTPAAPPELLYHGTEAATAELILGDGLRPMSRQYVHLSADKETATEVGRRKGGETVLLVVRAHEAHIDGHPFYEGNSYVWLADFVPAAFIDHKETP